MWTAASHLAAASQTAGSAAEDKYSCLANKQIFEPIAFETLGPMNSTTAILLCDLGRRATAMTNETRETMQLPFSTSLAKYSTFRKGSWFHVFHLSWLWLGDPDHTTEWRQWSSWVQGFRRLEIMLLLLLLLLFLLYFLVALGTSFPRTLLLLLLF